MAAEGQLRLRQRRNYRTRRDVLHECSDSELIKRFRLDREGILFVTNLVKKNSLNVPLTRNESCISTTFVIEEMCLRIV